jgi:60 kDa SS-A/Ro ribonucleoprotein
MTTDPLTRVRTRTSRTARTPQTVRDNPRQVQNNAGGYVYGVDDLTRLNRFLIMGSEGSYYASARTMTLDNAEVLTRMVDADPLRVVQEIVEISTQGRAAKQDPAIFALAVVAGLANDEGKAAAFEALPQVARTASTFFTFSKYLTQFRSWSGRPAGLPDAQVPGAAGLLAARHDPHPAPGAADPAARRAVQVGGQG